MTLTFYWYPKCSTCQKAKKWLDTHDISYDLVHIVDETPTKEEILHMIENSGLPARRFFNTSGRVYRSLNMKDKIKEDRKSTRLNSSHVAISYAVFCLKKKR